MSAEGEQSECRFALDFLTIRSFGEKIGSAAGRLLVSFPLGAHQVVNKYFMQKLYLLTDDPQLCQSERLCSSLVAAVRDSSGGRRTTGNPQSEFMLSCAQNAFVRPRSYGRTL